MPSVDPPGLLGRLRDRLAREGLHIVLPLAPREFDAVAAATGGTRLAELMEGAGGALLVGDGGPTFFQRFWSRSGVPSDDAEAGVSWPVPFPSVRPPAPAPAPAPSASPSPHGDRLDRYTCEVLRAAVGETMTEESRRRGEPVDFRLYYPFVNVRPPLAFQRLGEAAGLPAPGPVGLQIHPTFGPWWAYRGMVVVSSPVATESPLVASCLTCPRPCVDACPAGAVTSAAFSIRRCGDRRGSVAGAECRLACAARHACPVGLAHRYPERQLAFHMEASLKLLLIGGGRSAGTAGRGT